MARELLASGVQQIRSRESLQGRQRHRLARAPKLLAMEVAVEVVIPDDLSPTSFDPGRVGNGEPGGSGSPCRVLVELEVRIDPILQGEEDLVCLPLGHFMAKWTYDVHIHKHWSTFGEWLSTRPDRPRRRYHFDDRARRVIPPAAVAPAQGGPSWHIWYWPCSPSPSCRRWERVWPCIKRALVRPSSRRTMAGPAVTTITRRMNRTRPANGTRPVTTTRHGIKTRRAKSTRPPNTPGHLVRARSGTTTRPVITTTRRPTMRTTGPPASRASPALIRRWATPTRTKRRTTSKRRPSPPFFSPDGGSLTQFSSTGSWSLAPPRPK